MQPGPAGRGPGKKCPVSPPPSVLLLLRPRAEGTRSRRGGRSGDAAGGAEGVAEGASAGPGETIQFRPQQVEAGGLLQTFSRFAERARKQVRLPVLHSHLLCDTGQRLPLTVVQDSAPSGSAEKPRCVPADCVPWGTQEVCWSKQTVISPC